MDLSQIKCEVLESLLVHHKPVKADQVAKEIGKERPAVQMHLIGLTKVGYAQSPMKGHYLITENGKKVLGLHNVDKEKALTILANSSRDKAFHFYIGIGKPLNVYAHDLQEFCTKISEVPSESLDFHLNRGDFEAWFKSRGDSELEREVTILRESKVHEKELTVKLMEISKTRLKRLSKISMQPNPSA